MKISDPKKFSFAIKRVIRKIGKFAEKKWERWASKDEDGTKSGDILNKVERKAKVLLWFKAFSEGTGGVD